jgi:hypothetical protein
VERGRSLSSCGPQTFGNGARSAACPLVQPPLTWFQVDNLCRCELDHTLVVQGHTILVFLNPIKPSPRSRCTNQTHSLLEKLRAIPAAAEGLFAYSVKIVCGKQAGTNCCCVAGTRPGLYATEVNIQNLNLVQAPVIKFVQPLIHLGAVLAREPDVTDPTKLPKRQVEEIILPPLAATMDDCCKIAEMLPPPSGETPLTIAILSIVSPVELSVSAVYTANPLNGDGISIDVEYIPSRRLVVG